MDEQLVLSEEERKKMKSKSEKNFTLKKGNKQCRVGSSPKITCLMCVRLSLWLALARRHQFELAALQLVALDRGAETSQLPSPESIVTTSPLPQAPLSGN